MAKTKEQKKEVVDKLEGVLKGAASVFVHFTGVTVAQESAMRRAMRSEGLGYTVAKKTLLRRALEKLGYQADALPLQGELAIAYTAGSTDSTAAARRIHAFGKEFGQGKLTILGGLFDGKLVEQAGMQEIATIPPMATLQAMFAQIINSPRQRFAVVLGKVAGTKN